MSERVLTIFAHPDDETLAAGGTIHKFAQAGATVACLIPFTGIHARKNVQEEQARNDDLVVLRRDCTKALVDTLGVSDVTFGPFTDNEADKHTRLELIHYLEHWIGQFRPTLILTHHRYCTNIDHQYTHEAVLVATRPSPTCQIRVWAGEVPSSTGYLRPTHWEPTMHVRLHADNVRAKLIAMECFTTERRSMPHPRSSEVLRSLATVRGSEAGVEYAETFMVMREFA